jgi:hypothetical protein
MPSLRSFLIPVQLRLNLLLQTRLLLLRIRSRTARPLLCRRCLRTMDTLIVEKTYPKSASHPLYITQHKLTISFSPRSRVRSIKIPTINLHPTTLNPLLPRPLPMTLLLRSILFLICSSRTSCSTLFSLLL